MTESLLDLYPDIAAEWHPEKNGELSPDAVKPHSNKYAWWRCARGHEWQTKINNRTSNRSACPYCTGQIPIKGENDFATLYPTLLSEWDFDSNSVDPHNIKPSSNRRVAWKCAHGHKWMARVGHRVSGQGCPICGGFKPEVGVSDLATMYPDVAALWDPMRNEGVSPSEFLPFSHRRAHWKCPKGHEWSSPIDTVVKSHILNPDRTGCPVCSGKVVHPDNCLATVAPELAAEWSTQNELTPSEVTLHSNISVWWTCSQCGHEWKAKVNNRANGGGCPACKRIIATPTNNLAVLDPTLAAEWDSEKNLIGPNEVAACSNRSFWWKCENGHSWEAVVSNRYLLRHGCPVCANRKIIPGVNDLATVKPELAAEWDMEKNAPLTPDTVAPFSNQKVWWRCPSKNHLYLASIASRSYGHSCPKCSGMTPYQKKNYKTKKP